MATTKKRASSSATISKAAIEQVSTRLKDLPEKPKENLSLREAILELHGSITTALNRGYSYDEVVKILANQDVSITVASLKRYLAAARKESVEQPKKARRTSPRSRQSQLAKQAEALSTAAAPANTTNGSTPPVVAASPNAAAEPQKQTRTSSTRSKATAKSAAKSAAKPAATKTKTAAKAKPTSSAKTTSRSTSRSTSSRSRRKSGGAG